MIFSRFVHYCSLGASVANHSIASVVESFISGVSFKSKFFNFLPSIIILIGRSCWKVQISMLFCLYSNSAYLNPFSKVQIDNFIFSQMYEKKNLWKYFIVCSINYFCAPLTEMVAARLRVLFLFGLCKIIAN